MHENQIEVKTLTTKVKIIKEEIQKEKHLLGALTCKCEHKRKLVKKHLKHKKKIN